MTPPVRGTILYDADCPMCRNTMRRFEKTFASRGFDFAPLQTVLTPGEPPTEMRVRTADGVDYGGAAAVLFLARFIWWAQPLRWFARLPGATRMLRRLYLEVASRRSCDHGACILPRARS